MKPLFGPFIALGGFGLLIADFAIEFILLHQGPGIIAAVALLLTVIGVFWFVLEVIHDA